MNASAEPGSLLLVEDDDEQRELFAALLVSRGYRVTTAESIRVAIEALERDDFDLVVSDFSLPDGFANELLRRGLVAPDRFILVSGHSPVELTAELPTAVPHFVKPIDLSAFDTLLERYRMRGAGSHDLQVSAKVSEHALEDEPIAFVHYIDSNSSASMTAQHNLEEALRHFDRGNLQLEQIDLSRTPHLNDPRDRVVFTPTLVRRSPKPRISIIGDLSNRQMLDSTLRSAGLKRPD